MTGPSQPPPGPTNPPRGMATPVRLVAVDGHRIDAVVVAPGQYSGYADRLAAYAVRDSYGWSITRRRATGRFRTVARVDGLPEPLARRLVASRLVRLVASA